MISKTSSLSLVLLPISVFLTGSCSKVCKQNIPQYQLSGGQQAWSAPFAANAVWRFRNAAGYERVYSVTEAYRKSYGYGAGKLDVCPAYDKEFAEAYVSRTDSALTGYAKGVHHLELSASVPEIPGEQLLQWNHASFSLPLNEVESGQLVLGPATFGGRTYPAVLTCTSRSLSPLVLHVYLTKEEGVVAFDDERGNLWTRL